MKPNRRNFLRSIRQVIVIPAVGMMFFGCITSDPIDLGTSAEVEHETQELEGTVDIVPTVLDPTQKIPEKVDPGSDASYVYTYQSSDGNRIFSEKGSYPEHTVLDIPLGGKPLWALAAPLDEQLVWVVVLETGLVQGFRMMGNSVEEIQIHPNKLDAGMPPLLEILPEQPTLVTFPEINQSTSTHPVVLPTERTLALINVQGDLLINPGNKNTNVIAINAIPDARLLTDGQDRILLLSDPTERYTHGVLGDPIEAAGISLISPNPSEVSILNIPIEEPQVVEGISPIWVDFNGDGLREIIVTLSDSSQGAQLAVLSEEGLTLALSTPIGRGFRWRHQIAVAPLGPTGEMELVSIMTPHIGGIVEYFQWEAGRLVNVANLAGYSSHDLGSRNLDLAAVGDFDGDGHLELLVPNQEKTRFGAIRRTAQGAEEVWGLEIDGRITTNLTGAALPDLGLVLGVGRSDGIFRIWIPEK